MYLHNDHIFDKNYPSSTRLHDHPQLEAKIPSVWRELRPQGLNRNGSVLSVEQPWKRLNESSNRTTCHLKNMNQVALGVIYIGNISQKKVPKTFCQDSKTHKGKPYMQDESTNINLKHLLLSPDLLDHQCFIHRDFVEQTSQILYMQTQKNTHIPQKNILPENDNMEDTPTPSHWGLVQMFVSFSGE